MTITRPITSNYGSIEQRSYAQHNFGSLKPGQLLDAVALSNSHHGHVRLKIGNSVVTATTHIALQQNTQLRLEVVQIQPQLLLRLTPSTTDRLGLNPVHDALVSFLPRQTGLAPALAGLIKWSLVDNGSTQPAQIRQLMNGLNSVIPGRDSITQASGARRAMLQSGLFLEALLARSTGNLQFALSRDLKARLLRLLQGLEHYRPRSPVGPSVSNAITTQATQGGLPPKQLGLPVPQPRATIDLPGELPDIDLAINDQITRVKAAIARVGLLQVLSADNFNHGEQLWHLEIPVKNADSIELVAMTIKNERKPGTDIDTDRWVINLSVDLPALGVVQIRISFFTEGISTCFWSESVDTRKLIKAEFERLESRLQTHGLRCLNLCCQSGSPEDISVADATISNIDVRV